MALPGRTGDAPVVAGGRRQISSRGRTASGRSVAKRSRVGGVHPSGAATSSQQIAPPLRQKIPGPIGLDPGAPGQAHASRPVPVVEQRKNARGHRIR